MSGRSRSDKSSHSTSEKSAKAKDRNSKEFRSKSKDYKHERSSSSKTSSKHSLPKSRQTVTGRPTSNELEDPPSPKRSKGRSSVMVRPRHREDSDKDHHRDRDNHHRDRDRESRDRHHRDRHDSGRDKIPRHRSTVCERIRIEPLKAQKTTNFRSRQNWQKVANIQTVRILGAKIASAQENLNDSNLSNGSPVKKTLETSTSGPAAIESSISPKKKINDQEMLGDKSQNLSPKRSIIPHEISPIQEILGDSMILQTPNDTLNASRLSQQAEKSVVSQGLGTINQSTSKSKSANSLNLSTNTTHEIEIRSSFLKRSDFTSRQQLQQHYNLIEPLKGPKTSTPNIENLPQIELPNTIEGTTSTNNQKNNSSKMLTLQQHIRPHSLDTSCRSINSGAQPSPSFREKDLNLTNLDETHETFKSEQFETTTDGGGHSGLGHYTVNPDYQFLKNTISNFNSKQNSTERNSPVSQNGPTFGRSSQDDKNRSGRPKSEPFSENTSKSNSSDSNFKKTELYQTEETTNKELLQNQEQNEEISTEMKVIEDKDATTFMTKTTINRTTKTTIQKRNNDCKKVTTKLRVFFVDWSVSGQLVLSFFIYFISSAYIISLLFKK